jgi:hypothetical protein
MMNNIITSLLENITIKNDENITIKNDVNQFKLPIEYLEKKTELEQHTINDLELLPTNQQDSLYKYVLNPTTIFGESTMPLWSKYYTPDTTFLKESQELLKKKFDITTDSQESVIGIWNEIQSETGFAEKYSYIEYERLSFLNKSAKFLQCLSIYTMASPLFSLIMPIFFLILPLLIIKLRGLPITIDKYIELLKIVFKKHQIGKIFDLKNASFEKIIYIIASGIFYVIQIYQNIMSCRRFYSNMHKIHSQLFIMKDYLTNTIKNMDTLKIQCKELKTYEPFVKTMEKHRKTCEYVRNQFNQVTPNKLSIKKMLQVGHIMKCFYHLYKNKQLHETLIYSFGLNGYIDNLVGIQQNISAKVINTCKFKSKTKFTNAYFPSLVNNKPVKNSYKLDKHLIITGPNAAGKTTLLKTTIFNIIISQQIGFGFYKKADIIPYDMIHCYINIPDTSARDSLFQAEAKRCKDILSKIDQNEENEQKDIEKNNEPFRKKLNHFCVFDELYSGTNPYEAISSAFAYLKYLNKYDNVNFVLTTHFLELCRRLEKNKGIHNYHMKIETLNDDFKYTYKLEKGISEIKGGIKVLKDLDYPDEIINNTMNILTDLDI